MSFWQKIFSKRTYKMSLIENADSYICLEDLVETRVFINTKKMRPARQAVPAVLRVVSGIDSGTGINISSGRISIGRLAGSELLLTDTSVSRLHAFVVDEDGQHIIYDGKSLNGTYVNGSRITKKALQHGDSIKIANTIVVYEMR